ncbi:HD-GYP domain-containing protein [Paenibacillus planticolens]|uniref:HD-GYP domain-containing protein n=1 Tax=Paenibacillus planticolens TaxID=2654976 RepID=A0ABX1ZNI1_9BACL|nr:hypothetical protein [Paenibacillus planticolens]NOV01506.1 hypothetical protein [Paenibacillus planticolens]
MELLQGLTNKVKLYIFPGKSKIPVEIIIKPTKLTREEFTQIKNHTLYGFEIINNTDGISNRQALVALQHHEREDGDSY